MRLDQSSEGLRVLTEAFAAAERRGEVGRYAELYRLKGELLDVQGGREEETEYCFGQAIEIAQQQGAKALELRAAVSYVRQCPTSREALRMLADVYNWFTEGIDTADLVEARALLGAPDKSEAGGRPADLGSGD